MVETERRSLTKLFILVGGMFVIVILFIVFANQMQSLESTDLQNRPAPEFTLTTFEGETIQLSDLRGQIVVINFWASWCVECYDEAELLELAYQDYRSEGVIFVGVDYLDTEKEALAYMERFGITYPSGYDIQSKIAKAYAITGVPETFFIDRTGQIRYVKIGPIERAELYQVLDGLVNEGGL